MTKKDEDKNLPVNWEEQFAKEANEVAALERPAVAGIGFRGGIMTYAGNEIPGNSITGIAIAYTVEHAYYSGKWDADNPVPPDCFAQALPQDAGRDGANMVPHSNVLAPVSSGCAGCSNFEWGSGNEGRGKACKEIRKIAFIPYNPGDTAEMIATAEVGMAKIPVTSVKHWKKYINTVNALFQRPPWGVITTMTCKANANTQFVIGFEADGKVADDSILAALNARIPSVNELLLTPYTYEDEEEEEAPKGKKKY